MDANEQRQIKQTFTELRQLIGDLSAVVSQQQREIDQLRDELKNVAFQQRDHERRRH